MGGVTAPLCNQTLQGKNYSSVALLRHNQRDAVLPGSLGGRCIDCERLCCPCSNAAKQGAAEATVREPLTRGVHTGYSYNPASLRSEGGNIPLDWVAEIRGIRKGRKDRVVPLVKQAEAALKAYLKVRDAQPAYDEVFIARNGTSMDVRTVRYRIHKYYQEAGIKKKASVHTLRHTFSTHQIHNGLKLKQLKEVLGHRRMETTYKYVHLDRTNLRQEMEQGAL